MKINEKESIYYLKSPKIILNLKSNISVVHNPLSNIDLPKPDININLTNKFDKKYKTNHNVTREELIESKKNKLKTNKKNRKAININQDDLYNEESIKLNVVKSHKFTKSRKKEKIKDEINEVLNAKNQSIVIDRPLTLQDLAYKLSMPEAEIITYLFLKGIPVTINQVLDVPIAKNIVEHYNFSLADERNENKLLAQKNNIIISNTSSIRRAPIITICGHVDHGKTTLLDAILKTNLVSKEIGGITQSINGYEIKCLYESNLVSLVFLDTPGHEAFASMRLRGTKVADIVLLIIAADDGLKPQTIESIKIILEMKLTYIVVINKVDKPDANIKYIKEELIKYGIISEDLGGDAIINEVSALKGQNIDMLISNICLVSQLQDLSSNPDQLAQGTILESYIDKQKGIIANSLVQNGTLEIGHYIVSGKVSGRVKSILSSNTSQLKQVSSSSVVKILGFSEIPQAGSFFQAFKDDKQMKDFIDSYNQDSNICSSLLNNRIGFTNSTNNLSIKNINIILKTDTHGSLEAIINALTQISQKKIQLNMIIADTGNISRADMDLALTSQSIVIGFNIQVMSNIRNLAKNKNISLNVFNVIYELLDYVTNSMLNLVEPEYDQLIIGKAIVQTVFSINKGAVAGCMVNTGKLQKMCNINVYRNNNIVYTGILDSLKRVKDDVEEVIAGNECGVLCSSYSLWQNFDLIEAYQLKSKPKVL